MPTCTASDGLMMHYTTRGDPGGTPVVLLHGFPLSGEMWAGVAQGLPPEAGHLIVPDLRGFGRTAPSARGQGGEGGEPPSMSRYARDVADLLDALGERRPAVIAGLSMGGYIAFEFFRLFRERVRGLVLANTRAAADAPPAARAREIQAISVLRDGSARSVADSLAEKLFAAETPGEVRQKWHGIMAGSSPEGVAYALRAMATRPDSTPTLATIDVPTLIVVGDQDQVTPPEIARAMHAEIRGSRLEVIPGAGHLTPVEQAARFTEVLREFLEGLPEESEKA